MADKRSGNINIRQSRDDDDVLKLRAIFIKYLMHWPLFLASFVIAMAGAFIYYKYAKPVYEITATLVIEDSNNTPTEEKSPLVVFQELNNANAPKVVENEVEILKSYKLIKEVVDNLQLSTNYKLKDGLMNNDDLYGITPVKFNLYNSVGQISPQKLEIKILDTNTYVLLNDDCAANSNGTLFSAVWLFRRFFDSVSMSAVIPSSLPEGR